MKREVLCTPEAEQSGYCYVKCPEGMPNCQQTVWEVLPANHSTFDRFRCMIEEDMNKVIELALRECRK